MFATSPPAGAHPRMCGENAAPCQARETARGSSPHVRGKPVDHCFSRVSRGLIPACAGKTFTSTCLTSSLRAHPRMCGENLVSAASPSRIAGSSPHVRGKLPDSVCDCFHAGLIPACAGKTRVAAVSRRALGAHPRMCGENIVNRQIATAYRGSSPHVRGKLLNI